MVGKMDPGELQNFSKSMVDEIEKHIIGKRELLETVFYSILADGHILFEDYPGLAKTMIARCFSSALGCSFRRVQFTPDLLPADITGSYFFNRSTGNFELRKGPVFTNILLGDEINRAPPKTQSALLEAMQERQTTIEGESHKLDRPFIVIATQNPIEYEGTYPLPEAQLDRFLVKVNVGYPSKAGESEILKRRISRKSDEMDVKTIGNPERIIEAQELVENIHVEPVLIDYITEIVTRTRTHPHVEVGSSPRGGLALLKLSRACAAAQDRDFVIPDDIKRFCIPALSHRLILKPDPWVKGIQPATVITDIVAKVPVPKVPR